MQLIVTDSDLKKYLMPVIILFGSRIKGYGTQSADLDIAVFVRPDIPFEDRPNMQKHLKKILSGEKIQGKALEFWLTHEGSVLRIQDFPDADAALGDSTLTHVLFGGVWCGMKESSHELHEKLLVPYLYATDQKKRKVWLEEIERDTLQYRLMHKGYERFFPKQGGMCTQNPDMIDSKSMFWDSGYRRLATKLFIKKVFLPQLGTP